MAHHIMAQMYHFLWNYLLF